MSPHLPYAYSDKDEFHHPIDGWLLLDRAVVHDSWLSWRHVLPRGSRDCRALDKDTNNAILALAAELHAIHQLIPGYRDLGESPFRVIRWWDSRSEHSAWRSGRLCVFSLADCSSSDFIGHWSPEGSNLLLEPVNDPFSGACVRAWLLTIPAGDPAAPRPVGGPRRGRGQSRKRPSPPPGTPDHAPPAEQPVL